MIRITGTLTGKAKDGNITPSEIFLSSQLGEFDHVHGARYRSPAHVEMRFPELVEMHEMVHQSLAVSNFTDGVTRLFSAILEYGEGELRFLDKWRIERFLNKVHRACIFTHEVTANYYTFLLFAYKYPERAIEARKDLSSSYENMLAAGERAFGPVNDSRTVEQAIKILWVVPSIAIAALNLEYDLDLFRLSSLKRCGRFVEANSPDRRYRRILESLRPHWDATGLISDLVSAWDGADPEKFQAKVYERLRLKHPEVVFQATSERPEYMREMFQVLEEYAAERRYRFSEILRKMARSQDAGKVTLFYGASVLLPGLPIGATQDYTINGLDYIRVTPTAIPETMKIMRGSETAVALLVLRGAPPSPEHTAFVLGYVTRAEGGLLGPPFKLTVGVNQLVKLLKNEIPGELIVKIDERDSVLQKRLASTGHWVIVLLAVTAFGHIVETIRDVTEAGPVEVFLMDLIPERGYVAVIIKPKSRRLCYAAPVTKLGLNAVREEIGKSERIEQKELNGPSSFGELAPAIFKVISHCYLGLLQDYRILDVNDKADFERSQAKTPPASPDSSL